MKKTKLHQTLSVEEDRLQSLIQIAQGHADDGDPRAQADVINLTVKLEDVQDEIEDWLGWVADCAAKRRSDPNFFYDPARQ
jgi:hypothetical protein